MTSISFAIKTCSCKSSFKHQAPVVQKVDRINLYPLDGTIGSYPLDSDVSHISIFHMVESSFLFTLNSLLCHHVMLFFIDCPLLCHCLLWILALLKQRIKNDITTKYVRACVKSLYLENKLLTLSCLLYLQPPFLWNAFQSRT